MILVTVATHNRGFERLIRAMDDIAGKIDEPVIMQIGSTEYTPKHAQFFGFASQKEMDRLNYQARLVVTHAGAGSIIAAQKFGKPLIVMPRLSKYGEVIDDHQLELADALLEDGKVLVAHEAKELLDMITKDFSVKKTIPVNKLNLIKALRDCLDS